uniref:Teneurin-4 n=2 Tax=Lygus hesperus TaxID=30085 RepID=A0A0A9W7U5_LYGHE
MFSGKGRRCEKRCAVNGCEYSTFFNPKGKKIPRDVSFHRVPDRYKRPYYHQKWKEILNTEFPVEAYVCSMHFGDTDYHKPPAVLSSYRLRSTLREDAVPRFSLAPREQDSYALNENQVIEVKQEEEQLQYFPQETVYLPSSSTELFEENSESELSEASSEHSSLLFEEELEGAPFQNATDVSQFVQCELGSEKYRLSNGDGSTDDGQHPDLVPDDPPTSSTGNTATEGLDCIAIIPKFSNSKDQDIQCELGMEVRRRKRFVDKKRKKGTNASGVTCVFLAVNVHVDYRNQTRNTILTAWMLINHHSPCLVPITILVKTVQMVVQK